MKRQPIRNVVVDTAIGLYLLEIAAIEPYEPIRAVQVTLWAENEYGCIVDPTSVLNQLKIRARKGLLMMTCSHSPYKEYHFYLIPMGENNV